LEESTKLKLVSGVDLYRRFLTRVPW